MTVSVLGLLLALVAPSGARDCGRDPGPARPVSTTTCESGVVIGDMRRLLEAYVHRSCVLSQRPAGDRSGWAELDRIVEMLNDPRVRAHVARCAGVDPESLKRGGRGQR